MLRKLVILGLCAGTSAAVPILYESNPALVRGLVERAGEAPAAPPKGGRSEAKGEPRVSGRRVVVRADGRGHFLAEVRMNGRRSTALVDTGATLVALNRSTARGIGITLSSSDFRYEVDTANGRTRAASVVIPAIEIGRVRVAEVEAMVLEDAALSQTLIGMSFLKRLDRFEVADGVLVLSQ